MEANHMDRREFIRKSALVASGLLGAGLVSGSAAAKEKPEEKTRHSNLYRIDSYCQEIIEFLEAAVKSPRVPGPPANDKFKHIYRDLFAGAPTLTDPAKRIIQMDKNGIDMSILVPLPWIETIPTPYITPEVSIGAAQLLNNQLAAIVKKYPDRFRAVALLPTLDKDQMLAEFRRAVKELGMVGGLFICGYTAKRPDHEHYFSLDKNENSNLYAEAVKLGVPLWLHPSTPPIIANYKDEENPPPPAPQLPVSKYQVWQGLTWLQDSSVAMVRMVFAGVFEKHPDLKVIIHHHGALIPLFHQRMSYGWAFFEQNNKKEVSNIVSKPYMDHFKHFYCDTATQGFDPLLKRRCLHHGCPRQLGGLRHVRGKY